MAFNTALSGLNAALTDLNVTSNNIANASTHGFKESRAEFADVFSVGYQGMSKNAVGTGVRVAQVAQQHTQGNVEFTSNNLDLAVVGQGFFIVEDGSGTSYTRAGAFGLDKDGVVVNAYDQRLQAYPYDTTTATYDTARLGDLQLTTGLGQPNATTSVDVGVNLQANVASTFAAADAFDTTDPTTFNHSTSLTVYDSLGTSHVATLYFRKLNGTGNEWQSWTELDNSGTTVNAASLNMTFDTSGEIATVGGVAVPPATINYGTVSAATLANGAIDLNMTFDFTDTSQYSSDFSVNSMVQDGYTSGRLSGVDVDDSGIVFARFTNGQSEILGKVALASFPNPQGLSQLGDTQWGESYTSGQALNGEAGTGNFGTVQSGALESSNVELTEQLVRMITAQRNFQANSQMLSTEDQVTQTIFSIRR